MATSSAKQKAADKKTLETARRWADTTSSAENRDVYGSSARDFEVWYEREFEGTQQAG